MDYQAINLSEKLSQFNELWSPKVVGEIHNFQFKLVKIEGEFMWHEHQGADKVFMVLEGEMFIAFRDGQVKISKGEMFIVPGEADHKPFAEKECHIMLVEPKSAAANGGTASE
ncbi:cupin domain-containing protein [Paenibacillus aquistagni]|uniref:Cupin domain-containing protein n=1 Tax=Paenibacillus aquistagni TaxID=1852522 RepID=A0A1X7KKS3_9BACL|nr:cupin domain-containing protein [Paenibacillus aquistagni]NMM52288.1 cupin domain-containing protein [Paenibacillus aquistagni]SMG41739.1 Cupin domain-containing protein [Paenibacillus aquistagni]